MRELSRWLSGTGCARRLYYDAWRCRTGLQRQMHVDTLETIATVATMWNLPEASCFCIGTAKARSASWTKRETSSMAARWW